jgi:hypothetical protein
MSTSYSREEAIWALPTNRLKATAILFDELGDEDRQKFLEWLRSNYCHRCGSTDTGCQCWNDE